MQHIGSTLKGTKLNDLCAIGLVGAFLGLQRHRGKADGKTVIRNDLHQSVVNQRKVKELLTDDIYNQQNTAAEKRGRNQTVPKQGDLAAKNIAQKKEQQQ